MVNINELENYKKNLLTLLIIPMLLIGNIYITYGKLFDEIIINHFNSMKLYQLHTHLDIFTSEFFRSQKKFLPQVTVSIGFYSVIVIYILFSAWLMLFSISSYLKLSQRTDSKYIILLELFILLAIYIISIQPGLNIWLAIIGYLIMAFVFILLSLYWIYEFKSKQ